tara:strand:+ start:408 stop:932 length:525 start_codon:yes stop_codon:yes gene_type:complete
MEGIKTHILLLFLPLVIGNVLHMIIVKKNYLKALSIPISSTLFGANKTYRGFLVLPVLSGFIACLNAITFDSLQASNRYALFIGTGLGIAYMLFELPNSYLKRKLGIPQGASYKKYKILQLCIDKIDSLVGVFAFYYFATSVTFETIIGLFLAAFLIHISLSYLLVVLKIKKSI